MAHRSMDELHAGLDAIQAAPVERGTVELLCVRPDYGQRIVVDQVELDPVVGVVGDMWSTRPCRLTPDGSPHPDMQVTVMASRVIDLLTDRQDDWPLAGDQLYVDIDLSQDNAPPGTLLGLGSATIEITDVPHGGCAKFAQRFGRDALRFVNGPQHRDLRLRGVNAKVVEGGSVRRGEVATLRRPPADDRAPAG